MSFGSQFMGVDPNMDDFSPAPFGECGGIVKSIKENDAGTFEVEIEGLAPADYQGHTLKDWIKVGREAKSEKHAKMQRRVMANFLRACGYADFSIDPALRATHKSLTALNNVQELVGKKVLCEVGQYVSGKGYVNNEIVSYAFPSRKPNGVKVPQPQPHKPSGGGTNNAMLPNSGFAGAGFGQLPDYAGTGIENDPGPPDYEGGYATDVADGGDSPF